MSNCFDFVLPKLGGGELPLAQFQHSNILIVNVASQCGLTPQYTKLQALSEQYNDEDLVVLGVPCNQFLEQEPGTDEEIQTFCSTQYGVSFPMAGKIEVNGENRHPLYEYLAGDDAKFSGDIEWNFAKFLVNRYGDVVARFGAQTEPDADEVKDAIKALS